MSSFFVLMDWFFIICKVLMLVILMDVMVLVCEEGMILLEVCMMMLMWLKIVYRKKNLIRYINMWFV